MKEHLTHLEYEVELEPGEKLSIPAALIESVGPGHWVITIRPADRSVSPVRGHGAFLNGYSAEDEGLYDDHPGG